MMVSMGSSQGFLDHIIDHTKLRQMSRSKPKYIGSFGRMLVALPQDPCATFRADHRVVRILEHCYTIAQSDTQGTTRATFADDNANDRCLELAHQEHALGDDLSLPSLFGTDARVSPWGIDECDDRQLVFLGQFHLGHRFAVSFRMRTAEVACSSFLESSPFLVTDDHHLAASELGKACEHRAVISKELIAVEFDELIEG